MARPKKGEEAHPKKALSEKIRRASALGVPQDDMCKLFKIGKDSLHKYYREDLDIGTTAVTMGVGGKIIEAALKGEQWACALYATRRMGWKEGIDLSGGLTVTIKSYSEQPAGGS